MRPWARCISPTARRPHLTPQDNPGAGCAKQCLVRVGTGLVDIAAGVGGYARPPPPPMWPAWGSTTVSANPTPTAASMAFPPCLMISIPTSLASGWPDTTIALRPDTATALPASDQVSGTIGRPVTTASARAPRAVG